MVYAVEQGERHVYCSSPRCIAVLMKLGFRLSDPTQLSELVRALAAAPSRETHNPSDHLQPTDDEVSVGPLTAARPAAG